MRLNFLLAFSLISFAGISNALACTSPAGVAGEMGYDITGTDKYQYCDGTNWIVMSEELSPVTNFSAIISSDYQHSCAVAANNSGYCWGVNWTEGRGGNGTTTFSYSTPQLVHNGTSPGTWNEISTGGNFTCGRGTDNKGYCWGTGSNGRLGNGSLSNSTTPSSMLNGASPGTYLQISAGNDFACGLGTDNKAYCWGRGAEGSIGNGSTADRTSPTLVSNGAGPGTYMQISAGYQHACGIASTNKLYCWGRGNEGQIGDGSTSDRTTPVLVSNGESAGNFKYVFAGRFSTCAIGIDDKAYCWGEGSYGRLGNNSSLDTTTPVLVHNGENSSGTFISVSTGGEQSCGIGTDNNAYCWGRAANGRLGNGTSSPDQDEPVLVHNGANSSGTYVAIEVGFENICATSNNGSAYCWGKAEFGRLGNNSTSPDRNEPVQISNGENSSGAWASTPVNGLVGHWRLDETSGTLASDSSGNNNNGTMNGGLNGADTSTGIINNSLLHNGTSDYIEIPNDSSLNFVDFTTAGWFKTLAATGQSSQIIITKSVPNAGGGFNQRDFSMAVNEPEMSFRCGYRPGPTGGSFYATPETVNAITPGVWYHGACVYNSTTNTYTSYINGIQHSQFDTTANPPTSPATTGLTRIAGDTYVVGAGSEDFFNGDLDDIRLYDRALSASEIFGLYTCTQEGKMDYSTDGNVFVWCGDNFTSYDVTDTPGAGGGNCAASGSKIAGSAGAMQYDTANNKMVYCGGGPNWIDIPN